MNQINFNKKYLLIFVAILIIVLLILAGILVYFLYLSPEKNKVQEEMTQEELLKTLTVPDDGKNSNVSSETLKTISVTSTSTNTQNKVNEEILKSLSVPN
jgi:flagellar basal body-associated protein FliL